MPSIYDVKPKFQNLLRPIVNGLARIGVTANQVTIFAAVLSFAAGVALAVNAGQTRWLLVLPAVLFVRMALNAMDGMLAREHHQASSAGAVLNELTDVGSDAALYLPLALWPQFPAALVVGAVVLALVTEVAGTVAVQIGVSRRYDGPMGKSDRAFVFGAAGLALGLGAPAQPWVRWLLALVIVLLVQTVWNRARKALQQTVA